MLYQTASEATSLMTAMANDNFNDFRKLECINTETVENPWELQFRIVGLEDQLQAAGQQCHIE